MRLTPSRRLYAIGLIGPQVRSKHLDEAGFRVGWQKHSGYECDLFALLSHFRARRAAEAIF